MKVLNTSEATVILDDINVMVVYSRQRIPQDIPDHLAKRSQNLRLALHRNMLIDVTNGIPEKLPVPAQIQALEPSPDSPFFRKQAMLSRDDHADAPISPKPPKKVAKSAFEEFRKSGAMSVVWGGPSRDGGGFARLNRKFMFGLTEMGVDVCHELIPSIADMDKKTNEQLAKLQAVRVPPDAPRVYGQTAPLIFDWSRYKMLYTMMETARLHPDYTIRCNCADEIVVPSNWCLHEFQDSGVKIPISVVPLGVDTDIYRPDVEPLTFSKPLKDFVFLSVFGWSLRKGYDVLLKAYLEEFTSDDPVSLLISSRYFGSTDESKKQVIRDDIAKVSATIKNPKKPHVVLFGDILSDAAMPRIYASADCFVLISRGEGWGLPACEAAACNLPVITSRYSGHTDFCNDDNSYLVDVDGFKSAEKSLAWISFFYENAEFPIFGPKAVEQTRYFMRRVYENREEARIKSNKLHNKIVSEYTWPISVGKMYNKLKDTYEKLSQGKKA